MAPKKAKPVRRDQKHGGKNGKKEGLSGSSFFTWFMVIALLGVWTSVAVVWFDLVDYEEFLGKLGDYDADGDGDFDVDDAKVLLGLTKDGSSVNIDSLEEVLNILAEESSDWFYGFLSFLYDVMTPFEMVEDEENDPADDVDGLAQPPVTERVTKAPDIRGGLTKTKTKEEGLKERSVSKKISEDLDETDSLPSDISDDDLEDVIKSLDNDIFDIEDALDDHEMQDDVASEFSLEDAVEPSVHGSLGSEPDVKEEPEGEPVIEEQANVEEPTVEELTIDSIIENILEQELAAGHDDDDDDDVEEATITHEDDHGTHHEPKHAHKQEVEETETEFLNAPTPEVEEPVDVEDGPEPVADEEPEEEELATEEQEPQDEHFENIKVTENQEKSEDHEESVFMGKEDLNEPAEDESDEVNDYNDQTELEEEEEEPSELSDEPYGETVPEQTEEAAPETSETDEDTAEDTEDVVRDDSEEEINDIPVGEEPSESAEDHSEEPESPHEHIEVKQNEMPEHPVVDDRPSERAEEQGRHASEGQQGEHAEDESSSLQEKKEKAKKKKPKLLNKFDKTIKAELDAAEKLRKKGKVEDALNAFELLVTKYPQSPRARYGKAQSEDDLAEKQRSNDILLRAIGSYEEVAGLPNVPTDLVKTALKRKANRQQFLGRMRGSILTLQKLVQLYPEDIPLRNELGVGYLLLGDNQKAKQVYEEVLSLDPNNGFAKVHYGFILKAENKIAESIPYLKEGLLSGESGTDDGRFYFHLGDALQRVGDKEAYTWYEVGHKRGHFASVWQRSLYNVDGLKAQAWWTAKETSYADLVRSLEANWKVIREEGLAVMDASKGLFLPEDENLREKGDWSQYTLWQQGRKNDKSCKAAPRTCALLERFPESTGCRRGQIKYSVMHPGTHVWPHTGPTNCRLRMHLGLVIPSEGCRIRCANDTRSWKEGKVLIFDDSFEHEVWQEADSYRLIFIVDVWHPELTQHQRRTLPAI